MDVFTQPAISTPIIGVLTTSNLVSPAFDPDLGRGIYLTLSGTFSGTVQVQRSTDGKDPSDPNKVWNNTTVGGGQPWLNYTVPCDEVIDEPTDAAAVYRLNAALSSGSVTYRMAQ